MGWTDGMPRPGSSPTAAGTTLMNYWQEERHAAEMVASRRESVSASEIATPPTTTEGGATPTGRWLHPLAVQTAHNTGVGRCDIGELVVEILQRYNIAML